MFGLVTSSEDMRTLLSPAVGRGTGQARWSSAGPLRIIGDGAGFPGARPRTAAERENGLDVLAGHRGTRHPRRAGPGEPVHEDGELAPGDQRPGRAVRQRLGDQRAEHDDISRGDRGTDAAVRLAVLDEAVGAAGDL